MAHDSPSSRRTPRPAEVSEVYRRAARGSRVVERVLPDLHVEQEAPFPTNCQKVAIIAQFSTTRTMTRSLNEYVWQFVDAGYQCILVSASPTPEPLVFDDRLSGRLTILRKDNIGYDFGSWAVGLAWDPRIATLSNVVLTNDSLAGPFSPISGILEDFEESRADVFALTDNTQFGHHLQSFFLGFRAGVLAEDPLTHFWSRIRHEKRKERVILRNEVGLSRLLRQEGYSVEVAFPHAAVVNHWQNPTIDGWGRLLDLGFPFVKRELLRRPELAVDGERIPDVLHRRFAVDVEEWT